MASICTEFFKNMELISLCEVTLGASSLFFFFFFQMASQFSQLHFEQFTLFLFHILSSHSYLGLYSGVPNRVH